ncbi:MAG: BatA domain-containing protein [Opitutales bacterium]
MIEFGQPAALWTGLAIGLPILAHMAYRRITERHAFPSLRFITASQIPRTGRKTPTDLALLLLRILLFLAIMLLLADPYWSGTKLPDQGVNGKELLIAVDTSPSMGGWNGMNQAKEIASAMIQQAEGKAGLISFGKSSLEEWSVGGKPETLLDAVSGLSHGWRRGDAQVLATQVARLFGENSSQKKLAVISDFQRSDWQSVNLNLQAQGVEVEMIRVGAGNETMNRFDNRSIVESKVVPAGPGKVRIWAVVRNWSENKATDLLQLVIGGEVQEEQNITIAALSSKQAQFIVPSSEVSQALIRLVNEDPMQLDNQRTVWLKAPPPKHFGFWHNTTTDESTDNEKNFLRTAVESAGDSGWNRWEESEDNANELRMANDDSKLELLMVLGLGNWFEEEGLAKSLTSYLNGGGVVVVTPAEIFSETASIIRNYEWLNFSFVRVEGGASRVRDPFRIGALEENSKLADVFSGKAGRDLYLTSFRKFGILKQVDEATAIPMKDRKGRPLALVKSFSSGGKLVFFPFRMNTSWSDLPLRTSFLPLLMELTKKNKTEDKAWPILEPGEQLGVGENQFLAEKPGVFRHAGKWLEVVFPTAESTPDTLVEDEIKMMTGGLGNPSNDVREMVSSSVNEERNSLWLWFAILVASLLTIEMIWSKPKTPALEKYKT